MKPAVNLLKANLKKKTGGVHANGQVIAQHDGDCDAQRCFYLHDRLGSVRALIDPNAQVKNCYFYDPWGLQEGTSENQEGADNFYRFAGYMIDLEAGQYYCNARQYDYYIGRFTSRDPVRGSFTEPMTLHTYLYSLNDPVNRIDPTGEKSLAELMAATKARVKIVASTAMALLHKVWELGQRVYNAAMIRMGELSLWMQGTSGAGSGRVGPITGYTRHGLNSAISHNGVGVSPQAILHTVLHPVRTVIQANGSIRYISNDAVVVLNKAGQVVTCWALHSGAWRVRPG